jgi:hypothetical protein
MDATASAVDASSPWRPTSSQLSLESTTGAYDEGPDLSAAQEGASRPSSAVSARSRARSSAASGDESDEEERLAAQEQMHAMVELSQSSRSFHAAEEGPSSARSRALSPVASGDESDEEERIAAQQQMHAMLEVAGEEDAKRVRVISQLRPNHIHPPTLTERPNRRFSDHVLPCQYPVYGMLQGGNGSKTWSIWSFREG